MLDETYLKQLFAANLKRAIRDKGMTQQDFAQKAAMAQETVSRLVNGKSSPGWDTLARLCQALEVEPAALFRNEKESAYTDAEIELFKKFRHFQKAFEKAS